MEMNFSKPEASFQLPAMSTLQEFILFISSDLTVHDSVTGHPGTSAEGQLGCLRLCPAPGSSGQVLSCSRSDGIQHIICVAQEELCSAPNPSRREMSLAPASWWCRQAPCTLALLSNQAPLFPPPRLFLSPCKANKYSWRQQSLNTPCCSWAALCLESLTLLSTCMPAWPGCSWVPRCTAAA